jgi:hypothetical protein
MPTALELAEKTPPGMAHYAGTGPPDATCGHCSYFMGAVKRSGIGTGTLQKGRCREYIRIMQKHYGLRAVPIYKLAPDTPSCRHYEPK